MCFVILIYVILTSALGHFSILEVFISRIIAIIFGLLIFSLIVLFLNKDCYWCIRFIWFVTSLVLSTYLIILFFTDKVMLAELNESIANIFKSRIALCEDDSMKKAITEFENRNESITNAEEYDHILGKHLFADPRSTENLVGVEVLGNSEWRFKDTKFSFSDDYKKLTIRESSMLVEQKDVYHERDYIELIRNREKMGGDVFKYVPQLHTMEDKLLRDYMRALMNEDVVGIFDPFVHSDQGEMRSVLESLTNFSPEPKNFGEFLFKDSVQALLDTQDRCHAFERLYTKSFEWTPHTEELNDFHLMWFELRHPMVSYIEKHNPNFPIPENPY